MKFDILIKNGKIIDGTGSPWYKGDIGILNDEIKKIGNLQKYDTEQLIDAKGQIVCPGFIDAHTHFDIVPFAFGEFEDPLLSRRLSQGITTQIAGCCGNSMAPVNKYNKKEWFLQGTYRAIERYEEANWLTFKDFFKELEQQNLGTNYAFYVGHSTLRFNVLGFSSKMVSKKEMKEMKNLLHQSLAAGAIGMSTGLVYSPGVFSNTEELVELCSILSDYSAIYASHIRSDTSKFLKAVEEVVEIAEKNNIPAQIHHIKVRERDSSEKIIEEFFNIINGARKRGVDITMDIYPYNASWLGLDSLMLPPWAREGGKKNILKRLNNNNIISKIEEETSRLRNWNSYKDIVDESKKIIIVSASGKKEFIGESLFDISSMFNMEPIRAAIEIIKITEVESSVVYISLKEEDINRFLKCPYTMIGSDAVPIKPGWNAHPRNQGTFPRVLGKYVRENRLLRIEEAIHKMTGLSATRFRFDNRGLLKEGFKADIVVFNENEIIDTASYLEPFNTPKGIEYVIVNGCISIKKGRFTNKVNGKLLTRN